MTDFWKCPMCDSKLVMPDKPNRVKSPAGLDVITDVPCPKCPAVMRIRADNGFVMGFTPNQPIHVRRSR